MSENHKEALSALMDGELPRARAIRSIDILTHDPDLRRDWERYHLVRDALRKNLNGPLAAHLRERVRNAVASESITGSRRSQWRRPRPRRLVLAAVASVACVALLGAAVWFAGGAKEGRAVDTEVAAAAASPAARVVAAADVAAPVVAGDEASGRPLRWTELSPAVETRLNGYLVNHTEYGRGGMRGMLPYARIVAYERGAQ